MVDLFVRLEPQQRGDLGILLREEVGDRIIDQHHEALAVADAEIHHHVGPVIEREALLFVERGPQRRVVAKAHLPGGERGVGRDSRFPRGLVEVVTELLPVWVFETAPGETSEASQFFDGDVTHEYPSYYVAAPHPDPGARDRRRGPRCGGSSGCGPCSCTMEMGRR